MLQQKQLKFQIKSVDGEGKFTGLAAGYGNQDADSEILDYGVFRRSISHSGGKGIPVCWAHDLKTPVAWGVFAEERTEGLYVEAQFLLNTEQGRTAYEWAKMGAELGANVGISVGFRVTKDGSYFKDGIRHFKEAQLLEYSLCVLQANPLARVATVKNAKTRGASLTERIAAIAEARQKDFNDELAEQRVMSALYQERCDIEHALCGAVNDCMEDEEMTPDEKKAEISASLAQYAAAMGDWYSRFIDADQDVSDPEEDLDEMDTSKTEKAGRKISAATAEQIKAAMAAITDGAASHAKAIGILDDLSRRAYTANDVNQPNPVGGGKSESHTENAVDTKGLDPAVVAELTKAAIEQHLASKQDTVQADTKTEGDSQELHSLLESLRSIEWLLKK